MMRASSTNRTMAKKIVFILPLPLSKIPPSLWWGRERVGVRGSTQKHLKYCFYCNPSSIALLHPVIYALCKAVRDCTFSPFQ